MHKELERYENKPAVDIYGQLTVAMGLMSQALASDPTLKDLEMAISYCNRSWRVSERKVFPFKP